MAVYLLTKRQSTLAPGIPPDTAVSADYIPDNSARIPVVDTLPVDTLLLAADTLPDIPSAATN
jgi:hypothetical protein